MSPPIHVGARRCLARPRRTARQSIVADTSRPTRSAGQPSAHIHDRPAVHGRAQSPSRLKPADPNGPCTQPIDPGRLCAAQPPSGGLRTEPGASAPGVRCRPPRQRWSRHHRTLRRRSAAPAGRAGQAPPALYRTRPVAPTWGECPPHRRCADLPLSGRRASSPTGLGTLEPAVRSAPAVLGTAQPPVVWPRPHREDDLPMAECRPRSGW
jgi:hypothetical protein